MQSTGHSTRSLIIAAGLCSAATAAVAVLATRRWGRSLALELNVLQQCWSDLQHTVGSLPLDNTGFALVAGSHTLIREYGEVANNSLWDATNSQFCERSGTVISIDADGDCTVRLDSGEEIVCDVKFLVPAVTSELKANMANMQGAMRALSTAVGRAPNPVTFE